MQKQAAQKLVQETLQGSFDKERFVYLVKNILNHVEEAPFTYKGNFIFDDFANSIRLVERVGKYQSPDEKLIDILIVHLAKDTSLDRARTKQRNFVAKYLKGSRGSVLKDAALVAFVAPNGEDWRFSLVKMEYKFNEKGKVEEEFTPARRYSFLVGKNENSHTAQSRLLPVLLNDEVSPTLEELEETFSVERVTKEFFEKYRDLFLRIKEPLDAVVKKDAKVRADFKEKNIDTVDFAKKLLGQIVFLYFLQKKGWFGVARGKEWGSGSKHFLRELFEKKHGNYKNFFNDILEPLFYEALRLERSGDYYSRFNCRIPFLNGGLFDPLGDYDWWNTDILLPDDIFSNDRKTKEGDTGDGVLDIFDRYNFTVKEDEPLEKEVAVDPEMLGKVFENLLEVKDRKSKGTYYTPREIVHYMCQESLANYLATELEGKTSKKDIETLIKYGEAVVEHDSRVASEGRETDRYSFKLPQSVRKHAKLIDEKLAAIRVCDPAVGSGAFPVGMMNEIIRTRNALTAYIGKNGKRTPYHFKRQAIQNCLYGVDIDPGAVEIAKLRLWLSLVVDEEERDQIQPLPNLDYKIMQGNSLLSEFMGIDFDKESDDKNGQLLISQDDTDALIEKLRRKKDEYLNKASAGEKQNLKQEIEDLIIKIFEEKLKRQKSDYFNKIKAIEEKYKGLPNVEQRENIIKEEKEKLYKASGFNLEKFEKQLREYTTGNKIRPFFPWKLYFAEVFHEKKGFDVVIANPPYVKERDNKGVFEAITKNEWGKKWHQGKMDFWFFFLHKSIDIVKKGGIISFITSRYWLNSAGAKKLIRRVKEELSFVSLIDIGKLKVFDEVAGQHMVAIYIKDGEHDDFIYKKLENVLSGIGEQNNTENITIKSLKNSRLYSNDHIQLDIDKLTYADVVSLGNIFDVSQGVVQNPDKVSKKAAEKYNLSPGKGVFVLSENELKTLGLNKQEKQFVKPFFDEHDIYKYLVRARKKKNLLYITKENCPDISQYPNLKAHLQTYKKIMLDRRETKNGLNSWFHLHWPRESRYFENPKIILPAMFDDPSAGYQQGPGYFGLSSNVVVSKDKNYSLMFVLAILNSRFARYWFYKHGKKRGVGVDIGVSKLREFPVKEVSPKAQAQIISMVDKIIAITKDDPEGKPTASNGAGDYLENTAKQAKVREYEKQIDQLVYKLYGLTKKEIEIVEGHQS